MTVTTAHEMTEIELLHFYLGRRIAQGDKKLTIDQIMLDYAEYRRELDDFRATLREAEESSERGESRPLDFAGLSERVRLRLAKHGIT